MIISFSGNKGAGKDTAAIPLIQNGFVKLSFAAPLKDVTARAFNISYLAFESLEEKEKKRDGIVLTEEYLNKFFLYLDEYITLHKSKIKEAINKAKSIQINSYRHLLQYLGTDVCRNMVCDTIWLDIAANKLRERKNIVITDARFINERKLIKAYGGITILIQRPSLGLQDGHISEREMGTSKDYDLTFVNDRSINDLHELVRDNCLNKVYL